AYTGEVSGLFLRDVGCTYVLVGHSERRAMSGETDEIVTRKIKAAITHELIPIACIGESLQERKEGKTEAVLETQLKKCLQGIPMGELKAMAIAYEPIWAIGRGEPATVKEIEETHHFIRDFVAKTHDAPTANEMRLLYGGSVMPENAATLAHIKNVDGFLVGGASLVIEKFLKIIKTKEES
ncbi:MAG: triose-phosphate isomerase, partial [Candidatus Omnitrophota bacterium]